MNRHQMFRSCFRSSLESSVMKSRMSIFAGDHITNARIRHLFRSGMAAIYFPFIFFTVGIGLLYKIFIRGRVCVPYLELVITTKCSLSCRDCANLMPLYKHPYNVDAGELQKTLNRLFQIIDEVSVFRVIGGEPFMNPDIVKISKLLVDNPKIRNIVFATNGTIISPDPDFYFLLKHPKIFVNISDYGIGKVDLFAEKMKRENIRYVRGKEMIWYDMGNLECRHRTSNQLQRQFERCIGTRCILKGKMFYCPRQSHAHDLGAVQSAESDYVDLYASSLEEVKRSFIDLIFRKNYIGMCNYCDRGQENCREIKAGIQSDA